MTSFTLMWVAILVMELIFHENANGLSWKSKRTPSQSESGDLGSSENSLVRRLAWREKALGVNLLHRERRQYFQRSISDQNHPSMNHLNNHGTFNQDTSRCDEILSRSCQSPSDCDGCLGLFTCNLSQGTCHFKGVSSNTGHFYQSLQGDQEDKSR